jgi:hypothetical protein
VVHIHGITVYTGKVEVSGPGNKAVTYEIIEERQSKEKNGKWERAKF